MIKVFLNTNNIFSYVFFLSFVLFSNQSVGSLLSDYLIGSVVSKSSNLTCPIIQDLILKDSGKRKYPQKCEIHLNKACSSLLGDQKKILNHALAFNECVNSKNRNKRECRVGSHIFTGPNAQRSCNEFRRFNRYEEALEQFKQNPSDRTDRELALRIESVSDDYFEKGEVKVDFYTYYGFYSIKAYLKKGGKINLHHLKFMKSKELLLFLKSEGVNLNDALILNIESDGFPKVLNWLAEITPTDYLNLAMIKAASLGNIKVIEMLKSMNAVDAEPEHYLIGLKSQLSSWNAKQFILLVNHVPLNSIILLLDSEVTLSQENLDAIRNRVSENPSKISALGLKKLGDEYIDKALLLGKVPSTEDLMNNDLMLFKKLLKYSDIKSNIDFDKIFYKKLESGKPLDLYFLLNKYPNMQLIPKKFDAWTIPETSIFPYPFNHYEKSFIILLKKYFYLESLEESELVKIIKIFVLIPIIFVISIFMWKKISTREKLKHSAIFISICSALFPTMYIEYRFSVFFIYFQVIYIFNFFLFVLGWHPLLKRQ